jgi:tetratricopeptide (TPR) repeat protein
MSKRSEVIRKARNFLEHKNPQPALDILLPYIETAPGDAVAHALAGVAYGQQEVFYLAARHLGHSLAVDENQDEIRRMFLRALVEMRRWEDAFEVVTRLKKDNPNDTEIDSQVAFIEKHLDAPTIGWERDKQRSDVRVTFTNLDED